MPISKRIQVKRKMAMWTVCNLGKWYDKGMTLPQILLADPDFLFWAVEKGAFRGRQADEAKELDRKARRIKIPKPDPENWEIQYWFADIELQASLLRQRGRAIDKEAM
jgi:hypothetical protein